MGHSPIDSLSTFATAALTGQNAAAPVRYAIRQALDQEYQKYLIRQSAEASQARYLAGGGSDPEEALKVQSLKFGSATDEKKSKSGTVKRDFFGRIISEARAVSGEGGELEAKAIVKTDLKKVWVSFHEGFSK